MLLHIKKILEDMGWTDGYHIPVANKENLALSAEIERLTLAKAKATVAFEAISSKCEALDKHLKHVQAEQEQNQRLIMARQSELATEKDFYTMAKIEKERYLADIKKYNTEYEQIESRRQIKLKDLNNIINKIDKIKSSIEWDEDTIENWEDVLLKKQEDNDIIQKFSKEDQKKAKDLEIKREKLQEEFYNKKQLMIRTTTELGSLELVLVRNVQLYKQMHEERSTLVKQWQEAVKNLHQRDKETLAVNREIISTQELKEAKQELLAQEKQFFQNEVNNNNELDVQIRDINNEVARMRNESNSNRNTIQDYSMEFDSMKRELSKTATILQQERIVTKNLYNEIVQQENRLHRALLKVQHLKVELTNVKQSNLSANERVRRMEELIRVEENTQNSFKVDLENIQNTIFRSQKILNELTEYHNLKVLAIATTEQGLDLLEKEKQQLDKQIMNLKEQDYKVNFKLTMIVSKIMRLSQPMDDDEEKNNLKKMEDLEVKCKEVMDLSNLLEVQIRKLEEEMRGLSNSITVDGKILVLIKDKLQNYVLYVEGAEKMVKTKKNLSNQHQVEENILKVHLKHAENLLNKEGNTVFNLQKQQLELEMIMRERESEIKINKDILTSKKISLMEDNGRMRADIQGRKVKSEILKKRIEGTLASIGKSETGETVSVAYLKVKNAQEKAMLQEEGDRLDNLIRNTEKEIVAMENTLKAVNLSNESYKKILSIVDDTDDEILTEIRETEDKIYDNSKILRKYRQELNKQQEQLFVIQETLNDKQKIIDELEKELAEKEHDLGLLENEASHRKEKMIRADQQIKRIVRKKPIDDRQKKDFQTRQLVDFNKSALLQLKDVSTQYEEIKPRVKHYLSEHNLSLSTSSIHTSTKSYSSISHSTSSSKTSLTLDIPE